MSHSRNDLFKHIMGADPKAGGVDAGMAADIRLFQEILVNKQLNVMLLVIHQTEDAYRARGDVQVFFHISLISIKKAIDVYLLSEIEKSIAYLSNIQFACLY